MTFWFAARPLRTAAPLSAALLLCGCMVGPNYKGPPVAAPIEAQASQFHRAGDLFSSAAPAGRWWTSLNDAELDRLMEAALKASPDLAEARARIVQARAGLKHAKAEQLPTTGSSAVYLRSKGLTSLLGGQTAAVSDAETFQIYTADFDATWEIDLFGAKARAVEGARAQADAVLAGLDGAKVSLEAEVAQAYVTLRQLQHRLALSRHDAEIESRMLTLVRQRRAGGAASDLDVEQLNTQLQTTEASLTPISAQIAEQLDRLAVLTGREPGALDGELSGIGPVPAPPTAVSVGDPAALLRRRPDIRQAERKLAQSSASIGQHTADLFPKVTLLGTVGYTAPSLSHLFDSANSSYTVAPFLQWTPFDFGRVRAQIAEARGAYDESLAEYRKTVLGALQDAETSLARFGRERDSVVSQLRVQASAERASALQDLREKGGTASILEVLSTERQRVQAELGVLDSQAQLTNDYIALQKSLGLGWSDI